MEKKVKTRKGIWKLVDFRDIWKKLTDSENDEEIEIGEDDDDIVETAKELGIELPDEKAKEGAEESGEFNNFLIESENGELEDIEPDDDMIEEEDINLDLDFDVTEDLTDSGDFILDDEF